MLLMKRIPRSRLYLLVPNLNKKIIERREKQRKCFDKKARKEFAVTKSSLVERLLRDYQMGAWYYSEENWPCLLSFKSMRNGLEETCRTNTSLK